MTNIESILLEFSQVKVNFIESCSDFAEKENICSSGCSLSNLDKKHYRIWIILVSAPKFISQSFDSDALKSGGVYFGISTVLLQSAAKAMNIQARQRHFTTTPPICINQIHRYRRHSIIMLSIHIFRYIT